MARDRFKNNEPEEVELELISSKAADGRSNNVGPSNETKTKQLQMIFETNAHFMPLLYPLLFPHGDEGFHLKISLMGKNGGPPPKVIEGDDDGEESKQRCYVSIWEYYAYKLMIRLTEGLTPHLSGRVWQQYIVDAFTTVEQYCLEWIIRNQKTIRSDLYNSIRDSLRKGDFDTTCQGKNDFSYSPCMSDGKCGCHFSKRYNGHTFFDDCGFPVYRRRMMGRTVEKNKQQLDNQFVVPYNRDLLLRFQCPMNLEICNNYRSLKYLFKYYLKGHDTATMMIRRKNGLPLNSEKGKTIDEVRNFLDGRYVCESEAAWELLGYDIHYRYSSVERLPIHVEGDATYFRDLRTINGRTYNTYKESCEVLGLLKDDNQWHSALREPFKLRSMFVHILTNCPVADPLKLWTNNGNFLSDDILYNKRKKYGNVELKLSDADLENYTLAEVEKLLNGVGKSLKDFPNMPYPGDIYMHSTTNWLIEEETGYYKNQQFEEHSNNFQSLNSEQLHVYNSVLEAVNKGEGCLFFVYGSGGCGKTFLWKTLCCRLRSKGKIVLPVASSGIAATLLPGGRTSHSRFHIPLKLDRYFVAGIKHRSNIAELIKNTSLVI
ncbi:uncharacterized protein LOC141674518 [Apium graveolens]|uniref:uncharacterized protein LOC141674518 n=1 Tax=Apium graveolens TaxID=4045 RepID=UPI003D7BF67B